MKNFIYSIIILLTLSADLYAGDRDPFLPLQKNFVKRLYSGKRYFDCIAEARRLQLAEGTPEIDYFIYMNYYLAEQYRTVVSRYDYPASPLGLCAGSLVSVSYLKLGMYDESYRVLSGYMYTGVSSNDMNLLLRRVTPLILSGNMEGIEQEESSALPYLKDDYGFISLREELTRFREAGLKSPLKGALLSAVVPGLGQAYSGYFSEGLISFASVAATALGGMYIRDRGKDGYAYTLYFFSGLFYAGNIYGAWNSAERRNADLVNTEYELISRKYGVYNPESCINIDKVLR